MIRGDFAVDQVRRFRVTNYFAMLDEGSVAELARMLTFSENEIIAVAVVNQWLEEQTERPTPADLRRLVALHNEARAADAEPLVTTYKCNSCQDSGICGGDFAGPDAGPWEWCNCSAARAKRSVQPLLVEEMNKVRRRLLVLPRAWKVVPRARQDVGKVYGDV